MIETVDVTTNKNVISTINSILSNGGIAEVKKEGRNGVVVVEIKRTLKVPNNQILRRGEK